MGSLTYTEGRYVFAGSYHERHLPHGAGFRWDPTFRQWYTTNPNRAARLVELADEATRGRLAELAQAQRDSLAASRATDAPELDVPVPDGLAYLPFQRAGIAYAMGRAGTLIADEMGLGKTIQAVGVLNATPEARRVLILCPASLKLNWSRELERWSVRPLAIHVVTASDWREPTPPEGGCAVVIVNYDVLGRHAVALRAAPWCLLVADEAHYCKNPKAQRTKAVLGARVLGRDGVWRDSPTPIPAVRRLFLTGTPILNRPIEAWPLAHALAPETFGSWRRYVYRYCAATQGRYGMDTSGASNLGELQTLLRSSCMVRRLKSEVLTELPPKRRQVLEVPANGAAGVVAEEADAIEKGSRAMTEAEAALELAKASDDPAVYQAAVERLRDCASVAFQEVSRMRHLVALAKVPAVIAHATALLEELPRLVIFGHHRDVIGAISEALAAEGIGVRRIVGDTPVADRQAAVDAFQRADSGRAPDAVRVLVGSIGAMGVGLTMTAASTVVFAELDWVPANVSQAEDRLHRIGQRDSVLVQHLVIDGSLDARIAKRLVEKQAILDAALDHGARVELGADLPILPVDEAATASVRRKALAELADRMTPEQRAAVHDGLRRVAGMDPDRARALNGVGFNRLDGVIGHRLAECGALTPLQAALGQRLLRKYHRQLPAELLAAAGIDRLPKGAARPPASGAPDAAAPEAAEVRP